MTAVGLAWKVSAAIDRRYCCALFVLCFLVRAQAAPNDRVFDHVLGRAKAAAAAPYQPNGMALPDVLQELNYDTYRDIAFRGERSLWYGDAPFEVQFFHPGYLFRQPVLIHEVRDGELRNVPFDHKYFRYPDFPFARLGEKDRLHFVGLRVLYPLNQPKRFDEVISFLGSNYFRALGVGQTYGISARGIAVDTAPGMREEFPAFQEFWLCRPETGARDIQLFAFLDGPSVTGAYRFVMRPGADTTVDVEAHLFFRKPVQVLGLAPLTSMFWRGEKEPRPSSDPRPEVHDSDGLLLETESGEAQWHPLEPVAQITQQTFPATNLTSFSLLQRDRDPSHYGDGEAKYERRPSVRVESLGNWGQGAVRLMQLPAANEYNDNVVAFWEPAQRPAAGEEFTFRYRLHWFTRSSNKE